MNLFSNMKKMFEENQETEEEKRRKKEEKLKHRMEKAEKMQERIKKMESSIFVMLDFIGGMPGVPKHARLYKGNHPGEIKIEKNNVQLLSYQWGEQGVRSVGKAAAGAIIGGVLTGGVGAIVGGAMGGKKKDKSTLTLVVQNNSGQTYQLSFRCDEKQYNKFSKYVLS